MNSSFESLRNFCGSEDKQTARTAVWSTAEHDDAFDFVIDYCPGTDSRERCHHAIAHPTSAFVDSLKFSETPDEPSGCLALKKASMQ